jgi:hypothetical protein
MTTQTRKSTTKPKTKTKTKSKTKQGKTKKRHPRIFKKGDFYSGDGFLTTVWGPVQWHMLHTISFNYPVNPTEEQKTQYRDYILSLQHILPCGACRKNLTTNLRHLPLTMDAMKSRNTFSRYIYELHELVNKMLKKPSNLTYCDVRERYEHFRSRCVDTQPKVYSFQPKDTTTTTKKKKAKETETEKEKGCTEPLYGKKARCILNIVPQEEKGQSIQIDKKCMKRRNE